MRLFYNVYFPGPHAAGAGNETGNIVPGLAGSHAVNTVCRAKFLQFEFKLVGVKTPVTGSVTGYTVPGKVCTPAEGADLFFVVIHY